MRQKMRIDHERLKELRLERMLTQKALAELAGLSHETVTTAESGAPVSPTSARKIVTALGVEPKDLLPGKAEAPQRSGLSEAEFQAGMFEMRRLFKYLATPEGQKESGANIASTTEDIPLDLEEAAAFLDKLEADRRQRSA